MSEDEKNLFLKFWQSGSGFSGPMPDTVASGYLLLSVLRESETGSTCLFASKEDGRLFILKRSCAGSQNTALREYQMLKALGGRNVPESIYIPAYTDYFEQDGTACLIRDYLYGTSFRDFVESSPQDRLTESRLIDCALQLCEALVFLHSQKEPVIHRDIKPDNVIIDQYGHFRLIDFGIARHYRKNGNSDTISMGSECSAAPEQFGYSQTDARSDIYSLGSLLLYGATCEYEIEKLTYADISGDLKKIIRKCMQFSPKDRYQSAEKLRQDLQKLNKKSLLRQKRKWFTRGSLCGAGLAFLLFFCVLRTFPRILPVPPWNETAEQPSYGPGSPDDPPEKGVSGASAETAPEEPSGEAVYTFRNSLIERAVRSCLNKEEREPVTVRELQGIRFIGLFENRVLTDFHEIRYSPSIPQQHPEESLDPDGLPADYQSLFEDLAAMQNLRELVLINIPLDSLEGLGRLHLTSLALSGNGLTDYGTIATQTKLEHLILIEKMPDTGRDLSFLSRMQKLSSLDISNILPENGFGFLPRMQNLSSLTISGLTEELTAALKKSNVRNLYFWLSMPMEDIMPLTSLSGCTSLESVSINGNSDSGIFLDEEAPHDLPNVTELTLSGYYYRDFGCLSALENLQKIAIEGDTSAEDTLDCQNLDKLPSLKEFFCERPVYDMICELYPERTFEVIPYS